MKIQSSFLKGTKIRTIYFGGGTPSILTQDEINALFNSLNRNFELDNLEEITIEANPDDLTEQKVKQLKKSYTKTLKRKEYASTTRRDLVT